jgi:hypothetical protein
MYVSGVKRESGGVYKVSGHTIASDDGNIYRPGAGGGWDSVQNLHQKRSLSAPFSRSQRNENRACFCAGLLLSLVHARQLKMERPGDVQAKCRQAQRPVPFVPELPERFQFERARQDTKNTTPKGPKMKRQEMHNKRTGVTARQWLVTAMMAGLMCAPAFTTPALAQAYKTGEKASKKLKDLAKEVDLGKVQIETVMSKLNSLVSAPGDDLRKQYKEFDKAAKKMVDIAEKAKKRREEMQTERNAYLKQWDAELAKIQNEDIRTRSADRLKQVQTELDKLANLASEAGGAYRPFQSDILDIQRYLASDLTRSGLQAIAPTVTKANEHATDLRAALGKLSAQLDSMGVAMSSKAAKSKK